MLNTLTSSLNVLTLPPKPQSQPQSQSQPQPTAKYPLLSKIISYPPPKIDNSPPTEKISNKSTPKSPPSNKLVNFKLIYDPDLSKSKSNGSKPIYRYDGEGVSLPKDPRYVKGIKYPRTSRGKKGYKLECPVPIFIVRIILFFLKDDRKKQLGLTIL